jgi:hypothetical protein
MGDRSAPALSKREALSKMKTKTLHKAITAKVAISFLPLSLS